MASSWPGPVFLHTAVMIHLVLNFNTNIYKTVINKGVQSFGSHNAKQSRMNYKHQGSKILYEEHRKVKVKELEQHGAPK